MEEYHSTEDMLRKRRSSISRKWVIVGLFGAIVLGFAAGIIIGRFATCPDPKPADVNDINSLLMDGDWDIGSLIINSVKSENIRSYLKMLSEKPHLAGTSQNLDLARYLTSFWTEHGLDHVTMTPYQVLLSYPNMSDLNYVELLDENNTQIYKSNLTEAILTPAEDKPGVVPPFNAFSAPGDLKGNLVYVNYGRVEDYTTLEQKLSLKVKGKIVLARYGKIFRGDKVKLAEMHGAIGIILFSDPADYTGGDINKVYPNDWWLPPSGAQRGTVYIGDGDPLTPGYPSIGTAYREEANATTFYLPSIPSHPIGYGIAVKLMEQMGGTEVPTEWRGGMNVTYRVGGHFKRSGWKIHMKISTRNQNATVYNAFGIIKGRVEPDRYVLVGNHRDAWVFGAVDPSSGTAIMMEISRVMGELVKSGRWQPRRTIIFCSWGAEEYGLIGSTEWVEHYTKALGERAVAYLNVDVAVQGNFSMRAKASPLLYKMLFDAAKMVPNANEQEKAAGRASVYDTWLHTFPSESDTRPRVLLPGSGSDFAPFRDRIGVPVSQIRYTFDPNKQKLSSYPLYHSVYETFHLVDKIMDRGFKCHMAVGQVWAEMARNLADSLILPFNVSDYAFTMTNMGVSLLKRFGALMQRHDINTELLTEAISNFTDEVRNFESAFQNVNKNEVTEGLNSDKDTDADANEIHTEAKMYSLTTVGVWGMIEQLKYPFAVRRINDQLMQLERAFLDPSGLPGRALKRHILLAESDVDVYAESSFPGLVDTLFEIDKADNPDERWKTVRKHYSVILFTIQSAASTMRDVTDFMYSY